jgi:hypothetical protein
MSAAPVTRAAAAAVAAIVIQFVMVTAYAWPAARLAPRHLPVAVAGPVGPATAAARAISRADPGAFDIIRAASAAGARREITSRRVYGAIIAGGPAPRVLVASAASPVVAQLLTQAAGQMTGARTPVRDIVPIDRNDPRGAAFSSMLLPLVITSIIAGLLLTRATSSVRGRLAGLALFGAGAGAVLAAAAGSWLSILPGNYYALAGITGLTALAVAATVAGFAALAGRAGRATVGVGLVAAIMLVLGNPLSGAASAPEMLPAPWGQIGQWLPPGASATLLRAVGYFNGARAGLPWAVLAAWAGTGLALVVFSAARRPGSAPHEKTASARALPSATGNVRPAA